MTYFSFLTFFIFIPILALALPTWRVSRARRAALGFNISQTPLTINILALLALIYTTPWDNYLVATGVWSYNPNLVIGISFGYVPIEEYTFFIAETVLSGLWWTYLASKLKLPALEKFCAKPWQRFASSLTLTAAWIFFTRQLFLAAETWNYLGLIFFWALPPIFLQFLFGADILWQYRKLLFWSILIPGLYLSFADSLALGATTWSISPSQTLGIRLGGLLPLEEAAFFFITTTLIAFGMTLMLSPLSWQRFSAWKGGGFQGLP